MFKKQNKIKRATQLWRETDVSTCGEPRNARAMFWSIYTKIETINIKTGIKKSRKPTFIRKVKTNIFDVKRKKNKRTTQCLNSEVHEVIFEGMKWIRMKLEEASATTDFLQNVYNTKNTNGQDSQKLHNVAVLIKRNPRQTKL